MASKLLSILGVLALASRSLAGVATYAASPYTGYHYSAPAAAAVYHQPQPVVYHQSSPAHAVVHSYNAPLLGAYAAAPVGKTYAAAPLVKSYAASPFASIVRTYAAPGVVAAPAPVVNPAVVKEVEYDSAPRYDFSYGVHDSHTGDIKNQVESRNGGNVAGSYSVIDADGYKRTVTYTADDLNGFNAVVQREPLVKVAAAVVPAAVATPVNHVPLQQQIQYLPAQQQQITTIQQQHQHEYLPPAPVAPIQPVPASEPIPIEYPEQAQQQPEQQQPQYPQDQQYPPYPSADNGSNNNNNEASNDDSDVVEVRSATDNAASAPTAPAPVNDEQKESIPPKRTF